MQYTYRIHGKSKPSHARVMKGYMASSENWLEAGEGEMVDYSDNKEFSRTTHFISGSQLLTNKMLMSRKLSLLQGKCVPHTYQIINGKWLGPLPNAEGGKVWYLKNPTSDSARDLYVIDNPYKGMMIANHKDNKDKNFVVQISVPDLLLIKGSKFDIRVLVLIVCQKGKPFIQRAYIQKEGLIRLSTSQYDESTCNPSIHLTNYDIQVKQDNYDRKKHLIYFSTWEFYEEIYTKIKELVIETIRALKFDLNPYGLDRGFHLLGYDILIDVHHNLWLVEVNNGPICTEKSGLPAIKELIDLGIVSLLDNNAENRCELRDWELIMMSSNV